jgi:tRNA threonylcarbamoyladenosine biosynthesis protein TsaE
MRTIIVKEESELDVVARDLRDMLEAKTDTAILALTGDLGVGKTALTKALARALGIEEHITSPTFVIMKSYEVPARERFSHLTHIDAYRIESEDELRVLGFQELLLESKRLFVIEWPERIPALIPENALRVLITIGSDNERIIQYGD